MTITTTKKILLVDDEPDITFALKNILEDNGFEADIFNDPTLALDNYKVNFYDLVILDMNMPKMNGFQLYTKIKERDPKAKICFLTATPMFTEELQAVQSALGKALDMEYFIQKPIGVYLLIKKMTMIINKND